MFLLSLARFFVLPVLAIISFGANSADLNLRKGMGLNDGSYVPAAIIIKGDISQGDYDKFFGLFVDSLTHEYPVEDIVITGSNGGDLDEAIKIGRFIDRFYLPVKSFGDCYSACSFILLSAKYRIFVGRVGLHRPYFDKAYYAGLSAGKAQLRYKEMSAVVREYLIEQDVAVNVIDKMFSVSSSDMWVLNSNEAIETFGIMKPSFHEWVKAKCSGGGLVYLDVDSECLNKVMYSAKNEELLKWLEQGLESM